VLGTLNQISFNQGANGVWYFMESSSLEHDPSTYRFFPNFTSPCSDTTAPHQICWNDVLGHGQSPAVSVNTSSYLDIVFPPHSLTQVPENNSLSIVAWQSPMDGDVHVFGGYTLLQSWCTNGDKWSVDKGRVALESGNLTAGSASFNIPSVSVRKGEALYFTIASIINQNCGEAAAVISIVGLK
jgi:hypothetical protein